MKLNYLICMTEGHDVLCRQVAILYPDHGGVLEHNHTCTRCLKYRDFDADVIPPELERALRAEMKPEQVTVTVNLPPVPGGRDHIH